MKPNFWIRFFYINGEDRNLTEQDTPERLQFLKQISFPQRAELEGAERELMGVAGAPYRLAEPLSRITNHYTAIVIDTRPPFSLMTEMGLLINTDAIVPVEPRYLETVGLMSVISKINDIREGWRHPHLHVSDILVTKMDSRGQGH